MGFHALRHSFSPSTVLGAVSLSNGSHPARAGVDAHIIDHFIGHRTEEMRRRYQHLFPNEKRRARRS